MRVLFLNQYYRPDFSATAMMLTDLAEWLARDDPSLDIHVLTSRGGYSEQTSDRPPRRETCAGVTIHRLRAWGNRKQGTFSRLLEYTGFHGAALWWLLTQGRRFDVIVSLTDPPLVGLHAALLRRLMGGHIAHVHWSMDLFPDSAIAIGALRFGSLPARLLQSLQKWEHASADAIVALGPCMKERLVEKGVPQDRVQVIGVWSRGDEIAPIEPADNPLRDQAVDSTDAQASFLIVYSGNAGRAHTFTSVCRGMAELAGDAAIRFLFIGGGAALPAIRKYAEQHKLPNVSFLPYFPRRDLSQSLSMADVHLVTLREEMAGIVVPSKLYGIMAAARPIIYIGPAGSTIARQIAAAGCGVCLREGDTDGLVRTIRGLAAAPERCRELGDNGRRYFLEHQECAVCCRQWKELLHRVADGGTAFHAAHSKPGVNTSQVVLNPAQNNE